MEEITYQGAYIRTMTMIILEELLKSHKASLSSIANKTTMTQNQIDFIEAIEELSIMLLDINFDKAYL